MNLEPKLDPNIPQEYLYVEIKKLDYWDESLKELKGKRDKISKSTKEKYKNNKDELINLYQKIITQQEINMYSNKKRIFNFTKINQVINFKKKNVIKINPICMLESLNGGYDLYAFSVIDIFDSQEQLMNSLGNDYLIRQYITNTFLRLCYEGNDSKVEDFMDFVLSKYSNYKPSFSDIVESKKKVVYESSSDYIYSNNPEYFVNGYKKGFIKLHEDYNITNELILLLKEKMFETLDDWIKTLNETHLERIESLKNNKNEKNAKKIKKLLIDNMNNENIKKLYKLLGFENFSYKLTLFYNEFNQKSESIIYKASKIEDIEKFIIRNYECNFNAIIKGQINCERIYSLDGTKGYSVKLETIGKDDE